MREHDPLPPGENGSIRCRHCGALLRDGIVLTCIDRPDPHGPPPRPWRGSALDDNDAMSARLAEMRRERDAEHARQADDGPVLTADDRDWCCG